MPPARIPGRLTSSCLISSTCGAIFWQSDPIAPAVWRVCHIPPDKLPAGFDNLSMHSCAQDRMVGAGLPSSPLPGGCHGPLPAFYRLGEATIRTRGENRMTGMKHSPRTDLIAL